MFRKNHSNVYDDAFFAVHFEQSLRSAKVIAPVVHRLFSPRSIVDVGCGLGAWLQAFSEGGKDQICGIDGAYVNPENLLIPPAKFIAQDLSRSFEIPGRYDLAISLEAAEHLSGKAGAHLVHTLTKAAPLVMSPRQCLAKAARTISTNSGAPTGVHCSLTKDSGCSVRSGH